MSEDAHDIPRQLTVPLMNALEAYNHNGQECARAMNTQDFGRYTNAKHWFTRARALEDPVRWPEIDAAWSEGWHAARTAVNPKYYA